MKIPVRLSSTPHEKVWGSPATEPWHRNPEGRKIGEVWFAASEAAPLLVKFLFTSENLSVQVHPDDEYARKHENSRGKTEMWHILQAERDAKIALGLRTRITPERLREASLSGEIMDLLNWVPAQPGDTFFIPAGTIHAIGAGIVLCEVQQLSDVTYRLYDYGRPRELHLEKAMDVSHLEPRSENAARELPVESAYFRTERLKVEGSAIAPTPLANTLYIALEGEGTIAGNPFAAGEAWEVSAGAPSFEITGSAVFLTTYPR
ncbi:MAG TPA: class I mannose-6-phosphate isomerase [Bryobacteraceae bacterium]|nr:class I mannose-6-phosphate isomerase [Bryobacteraceae bacterium]